MLRYEKSVVINAPLEEVFPYIADPAKFPLYWVGLDAVKDIQRLPNGGYRYTGLGKDFGQSYEATVEDGEFVPNKQHTGKSRGPSLEFAYTCFVERVEAGKTRVGGVLEYTFAPEIEAKLGVAFLAVYYDHALELTFANLKACVEARVPAGAIR